MIIGIGADLVDIRRIERLIQRFGPRFTARIFTPRECARAQSRAKPAASFAKRFAAKEACAKALGTGFSRGVIWQDMEVMNTAEGMPRLCLAGGAAARLDALIPDGYRARVHLSLTDDYPLAQAFVMISAESVRDIAQINSNQGPP